MFIKCVYPTAITNPTTTYNLHWDCRIRPAI